MLQQESTTEYRNVLWLLAKVKFDSIVSRHVTIRANVAPQSGTVLAKQQPLGGSIHNIEDVWVKGPHNKSKSVGFYILANASR